MIRHEDIVDYWARRIPETDLSVDWTDAHERCWRCAYKCRLDRCHIVPHALGGPDEPSNLVLLCGRCHREAPNVADSEFMWHWLRSEAVALYDTYWTNRGLAEYEKIFKSKAFSWIQDESMAVRANELIGQEMRKTTIHWGDGRLNPSTIAWVIWKVEGELKGTARG